MSNASDRPEPGERPEGQETGPPESERPSAPDLQQDETRPEAGSSAAGVEPAEPAAAEATAAAGEPGDRVDEGESAPVPGDGPAVDGEGRSTGAADATEPRPADPDTGGTVEHPQPGYVPPAGGLPPGYAAQGLPGYGRPGYDQPGYGHPGYGQTYYGQTGYAQAAYGPSGYDAPAGYGPSGYDAPAGYGPPGYGQVPGYGPPPYGGVPGGPPPHPGVVPLRPLTTGDVVAGAVRYIRDNPLVTLGASAAVMVLAMAIQLVVEFTLPRIDPAALARGRTGGLAGSLAGVLGSTIVSIVLSTVLAALLLVVLSQAVLGRHIQARDAWRVAGPRVPGLVGLTLLVALVVVVILVIPVLLALLTAATGSGRAIGLGIGLFLVAVVATVYVSVLWVLASAAYVLEPIGVVAALQRSGRLVRGAWWRTFGVLLVCGLLVAIPVIVVMGLLGALTVGPADAGVMVRAAIATVVVGTFATPFGVGVTGLLYVDQRIRKERLDLELARSAG